MPEWNESVQGMIEFFPATEQTVTDHDGEAAVCPGVVALFQQLDGQAAHVHRCSQDVLPQRLGAGFTVGEVEQFLADGSDTLPGIRVQAERRRRAGRVERSRR
ncbi:MAG: hypothetical protein IIA64_04725 [Planctomycetes bacterium]|nr:hypothetical protein [Planctomycetota bacterium]